MSPIPLRRERHSESAQEFRIGVAYLALGFGEGGQMQESPSGMVAPSTAARTGTGTLHYSLDICLTIVETSIYGYAPYS